ncbi:hypothetical protein FRC05_006248 [Tulasnella sp. 425]|nr:hypothetical protein FRC05_006248 [Tulasnella sp. 425]
MAPMEDLRTYQYRRTGPRRPPVELEEVPDIDDDTVDASSDSDAADSEFELEGVLSDNSKFDSDSDDDVEWIQGVSTRVSAEEKLNDCFNAEAVKRARNVTEDDMDYFEAFNYKVDTHLGDNAYLKLPRSFRRLKGSVPSIDVLQRRISQLSGVRPRQYHCCRKSCCCFTGQYAKLNHCPYCREPRYDRNGKPVKIFNYQPLIPRLKQWFRNPDTVTNLMYRSLFKLSSPDPNDPAADWEDIIDVFDGEHYLSLLDEPVTVDEESLGHSFFSDDRDIALGLSFDGFCPFKRRKQTCWPIILFNYNLPPEVRFHLDNILCVGVIPGPKQVKDTDSFLWPLVEEMKTLAKGITAFDAVKEESFTLHAYILLAFGDIPAVAKLMQMKGHNGRRPCRMCMITGIRIPPPSKITTLYTPLWRPNGESYDPLNLPLRTHSQFMSHASFVVSSANDAEEKRRATATGIKGYPILAELSSLRFPQSFPYDFMHVVWENVVKTLANLWCGDYKNLDEGKEEYGLDKTIWSAIGEACKISGDSIPSAFGCRVPNIAEERSHFIAESWSQWCMYLAPALLRKRFKKLIYYTHFTRLVSLLNKCLSREISFEDVDRLKNGFAEWVTEYERVRMMGPVWCYWAFPMERFCGSLLPAIKSRRFPYASIDRRVTELSQLYQIKILYGLRKNLDLRKRRDIEQRGVQVLGSPSETRIFSHLISDRLVNHIATRFNARRSDVKSLIPRSAIHWGKLQWLNDGDMMHALDFIKDPSRPGRRDMTFVKYTVLQDRHFHRRNRAPAGVDVEADYYGQLQSLFVLKIPPCAALRITTPETLALAAVLPIRPTGQNGAEQVVCHANTFDPLEVIDIQSLQCLVGRVVDRNKWIFVEQLGSREVTQIGDDPETAVHPQNTRLGRR